MARQRCATLFVFTLLLLFLLRATPEQGRSFLSSYKVNNYLSAQAYASNFKGRQQVLASSKWSSSALSVATGFSSACLVGWLQIRRQLGSQLRSSKSMPPPPPVPDSMLRVSYEAYLPHFVLSVMLTVAFATLAYAIQSPIICALAGAMAVPLMHLQHNIHHLKQSQKTAETLAIANFIGFFTGSNLSGSAWDVHKRHHSRAGEYLGWGADTAFTPMEDTLWDLDDLCGPLRNGNPLGSAAAANPILRFLVAAMVILASSTLVHAVSFPAQSLLPVLRGVPKGKKGGEVLVNACIGLAHLGLGLVCLGPAGFLWYSLGFSLTETNCNVGTHDPTGSGHYASGNYWKLQLQSTTNFAHHDNWLVRHMYMGDDYHIEHHLWPDVPEVHLPKLAPAAQEYCEANGLEYREVKLFDAWQSWWQEAYRLAGELAPVQREHEMGTCHAS